MPETNWLERAAEIARPIVPDASDAAEDAVDDRLQDDAEDAEMEEWDDALEDEDVDCD